jgi:hypothetical protein
MVVRYQIEFENAIPTIEGIASQFRESTGLALAVEPFGARSYSLSAAPLRRDVELVLGNVVELFVFRAHLGYLEWAILKALQRLGGRVPAQLFPGYASVPWSSLTWYRRWLHR